MASPKAYSAKDMNGNKVTNLAAPTPTTNDAARIADVETASTADRSRANHTGSQLAGTISNFDAQVRTSRLDQMAAPTASVPMGSQKITSLADPTTAQEAATKNYVDNQLSGVVSNQILKGEVRVALSTNVSLAAPGASVDGVTMVAGDIMLLMGQTTGSQNGPYVWNGAAVAATRAPNWDTAGEAIVGSYWLVAEGTNAEKFILLNNDTFTLNTTVGTFTPITASTSIGRYAVDCPVVTAGGTWTVTHNLGSMDVSVDVRRVASPYDYIDVYCAASTINTVTVSPDLAFAAAEFRAIVKY